jgi:hypothetical protein
MSAHPRSDDGTVLRLSARRPVVPEPVVQQPEPEPALEAPTTVTYHQSLTVEGITSQQDVSEISRLDDIEFGEGNDTEHPDTDDNPVATVETILAATPSPVPTEQGIPAVPIVVDRADYGQLNRRTFANTAPGYDSSAITDLAPHMTAHNATTRTQLMQSAQYFGGGMDNDEINDSIAVVWRNDNGWSHDPSSYIHPTKITIVLPRFNQLTTKFVTPCVSSRYKMLDRLYPSEEDKVNYAYRQVSSGRRMPYAHRVGTVISISYININLALDKEMDRLLLDAYNQLIQKRVPFTSVEPSQYQHFINLLQDSQQEVMKNIAVQKKIITDAEEEITESTNELVKLELQLVSGSAITENRMQFMKEKVELCQKLVPTRYQWIKFNEKKPIVEALTQRVIVDFSGLKFDFGILHIKIDFTCKNTDGITYLQTDSTVYGIDRAGKRIWTGQTPHISNGHACFGNIQSSVVYAFINHDFYNLLLLLSNHANSYSAINPYFRLGSSSTNPGWKLWKETEGKTPEGTASDASSTSTVREI